MVAEALEARLLIHVLGLGIDQLRDIEYKGKQWDIKNDNEVFRIYHSHLFDLYDCTSLPGGL